MGAWSEDMLGSDDAMDTLAVLGDCLRLSPEIPLYPLPDKHDRETIFSIREQLIRNEAKIIKHKWETEDYPVIACVYLATGAQMPTELKDKAIDSCEYQIEHIDEIGWSDEAARIRVLKNHICLLENHGPGKITEIEYTGLFTKIWRGDHNL